LLILKDQVAKLLILKALQLAFFLKKNNSFKINNLALALLIFFRINNLRLKKKFNFFLPLESTT